MPQLDLGIYFIQIYTNIFFFWFLYFYIKFFILGKLSNIIKIKNFLYFNNNYTYATTVIFFNNIELNYYRSNIWSNFYNFDLFLNFLKFKNLKIFNLLFLQNIYYFLNLFLKSILLRGVYNFSKLNILN